MLITGPQSDRVAEDFRAVGTLLGPRCRTARRGLTDSRWTAHGSGPRCRRRFCPGQPKPRSLGPTGTNPSRPCGHQVRRAVRFRLPVPRWCLPASRGECVDASRPVTRCAVIPLPGRSRPRGAVFSSSRCAIHQTAQGPARPSRRQPRGVHSRRRLQETLA